ncbi:hypothetical protein [Lysobacter gummosus]|uniref:hypothetical protein n=1 Tax=Lysobacter gummosus TaxID=262324 RepID=UPI00363A76C6
MWPTVIEAGFAELYGRDAQGKVDLDRGYRTIGAVTGGGGLSDGVYALTGESGRSLQIRNPDAPPMRPTGPNHVKPLSHRHTVRLHRAPSWSWIRSIPRWSRRWRHIGRYRWRRKAGTFKMALRKAMPTWWWACRAIRGPTRLRSRCAIPTGTTSAHKKATRTSARAGTQTTRRSRSTSIG